MQPCATAHSVAIMSAPRGWARVLRPALSIADARVFGTRNLFVASSAVFPTTSQANPTLTIVAMALRLADHLEAAMKADSEPVVARGRSARAMPAVIAAE